MILLNIVALVISILSATLTVVIAFRQSGLTRHTNELPILVELTQEFRSTDFQQAEEYILSQLAEEASPEVGTSGLPADAKHAATTVNSLFISFGAYIVFGLADEKIVVSLFGYRADRLWRVLEPYVMAERALRGNDNNYCNFFEDLVCRTRDNWPVIEGYGIEVQHLNDQMKPWRASSVLNGRQKVPRRSRYRVFERK